VFVTTTAAWSRRAWAHRGSSRSLVTMPFLVPHLLFWKVLKNQRTCQLPPLLIGLRSQQATLSFPFCCHWFPDHNRQPSFIWTAQNPSHQKAWDGQVDGAVRWAHNSRSMLIHPQKFSSHVVINLFSYFLNDSFTHLIFLTTVANKFIFLQFH
jgi:hypothetical protein